VINFLTLYIKKINHITPPWKQPKPDDDKKFHEALQKLKTTLHVALRGEWQLYYGT
jgi:hypothetical protein